MKKPIGIFYAKRGGESAFVQHIKTVYPYATMRDFFVKNKFKFAVIFAKFDICRKGVVKEFVPF